MKNEETTFGSCDGKCEGKYSTLTPTLTTESPINRAFQANCEGVRVEKEKKFFYFLEVDELKSYNSIRVMP